MAKSRTMKASSVHAGQIRPNGMATADEKRPWAQGGALRAKLRVSGGVETFDASGHWKGEEAFQPTCSIRLTYGIKVLKNG